MAERLKWSAKLRAERKWHEMELTAAAGSPRSANVVTNSAVREQGVVQQHCAEIDAWMWEQGRGDWMFHIQDRDRRALVAFENENDFQNATMWFCGEGVVISENNPKPPRPPSSWWRPRK